MRQVAARAGAGVTHIHELNRDIEKINNARAIALCVDSADYLLLNKIEAGTAVVIDECNAVAEHILGGETLKENHEKTISHTHEILKEVARKGGFVLCMEHEILDHTVDYWNLMVSHLVESQIILNTQKTSHWEVTINSGGRTGFLAELIKELNRGNKIHVPTDSQRLAEQLEKQIELFNPGKKVLRVDRNTISTVGHIAQDFMENPDATVESYSPDLLITSPTAESGVSIWWNKIDKVYAAFSHCTTRQAVQMLERCRLNVPRVIFCPERAVDLAEEKLLNVESFLKYLEESTFDMVKRTSYIKKLKSDADYNKVPLESLPGFLNLKNLNSEIFHQEQNKFAAIFKVSGEITKFAMRGNLEQALQDLGHHLLFTDPWVSDTSIYRAIQDVKAVLLEEKSQKFAEVDATGISVEDARRKLQTHELSDADRLRCEKRLWIERLPAYDMEDFESVKFLLGKDSKEYTSAQRRIWFEYPELLHKKDRAAIASRLEHSNFVMLHSIPRGSQQIDLLRIVKPFVDRLVGCTYSESNPDVKDLNSLLVEQKDLFQRVTGLKFEELRTASTDLKTGKKIPAITAITNVNKVLRWFGYSTECVSRLGARGERQRQ
jgi:hypothetical protein